VLAAVLALSPPPNYEKDLDALLFELKTYGAYVREDRIDFAKFEASYRPKFKAARTASELFPIMEAAVAELHDFHASLGSNTPASPRLVPSGTDLYGEWKGERAFLEQVRPGSLAERAGLQAGDEVVAIDGQPVRTEAGRWIGALEAGSRGWSWALNSALAGRWNTSRNLTYRRAGREARVAVPTAQSPNASGRLTLEKRDGLVLIRPEDSLGDYALLKDLDEALPTLRAAKGIVLDLRNTPSGGNTKVARGIMGLFISRRLPYQRHVVEERETGTVRDWVEYATPRLERPLVAKLVVLVSRWTGSMGEGLAIGLDGMKRATVIGTPMAGLRGAIGSTTLPESQIRVFFPIERLYHVDGTPRHEWVPRIKVKPGAGDPWMIEAKRHL
jgi:carboxyl-terminal processing protease